MNYSKLYSWTSRKLNVTKRLKSIAIGYVLFLLSSTRKHTLQAASEFSGLNKSSFSKLLKNHSKVAIFNLDELSKKQAKQFGKHISFMAEGQLPWKIAIIIDATLQNRSTLHAENVKRFNHGKGFVIGHQWTNIVLFFNDILIPLPPIAFYTKAYCRKNSLEYRTEHENVVDYIKSINLKDYFGPHDPKKVVVLADSGYDSKEIENAIQTKQWKYVIALKKSAVSKPRRNIPIPPNPRGGIRSSSFSKITAGSSG